MNTKTVTIFTDGSSRGNPGPGGWGSVIVTEEADSTGSAVREIGGAEKNTTNNRMELMAAAEGLKKSPEGARIIIYTDSSYLINGITKWVKGWKRNGWKTQTKQDVVNRDIWEMLDGAVLGRAVEWRHIGGHVGIVGNERCDVIATSFADGDETKLYNGPLSGYELQNILDVSHDETKAVAKKSSSSHSRAAAYSYVSAIGGVIQTHRTWAECEKRVKGMKGARFKKSISAENESEIRREFGGN